MKRIEKLKSLSIKTIAYALSALIVSSVSITVFAGDAELTTVGASDKTVKAAVELSRDGDGYSSVLYDSSNGLPTSEANAIAETSDGFVWIGSYGGLIKYDGTTFERIQPSKEIASIVNLFVDSKDRLWIGTNDSGVACMHLDDTKVFNKADGLRSLYVHSITEDNNGNIYIATELGIAIVDNDMQLHLIEENGVSYEHVRDLRAGGDGRIYGSTTDGTILTIKDGKIDTYYAGLKFDGEGIYSFSPDSSNPGYVYIGTTGSAIYYGLLDGSFDDFKRIDISPLKYVNAICQIGDQFWICADTGIGLYENGAFTVAENLPMTSSVETIMIDYQGNLWFTSSKQGVMKIVPNRFEDVFYKHGIDTNVVNSTCWFQDKLFIGCKTSGLIVLDGDEVKYSFPVDKAVYASGEEIEEKDLVKLLEGGQIRSIINDGNNKLWFSTMYGDKPVVCYENGVATCFTKNDGLPSERARAVVLCNDGSALAVVTGGIARIRDGKVEKVYNESDGIENTDILTAAEADNGDIIIGTNGNGIYVISDNGCKHIDTESGLMSEVIMRVKKDVSRDIYWLVTSNAISYLDKDYNVKNVTDFPYSNNFDLYENTSGDMWVLSSSGIYVVSVDEMIENNNITALLYNRHNGLPCTATANSYSVLTPDGDLYIAGVSGVVKVNVEKSFEDLSNIKMAVPYIEIDGKVTFPDENGNYVLPSSAQRLTICEYVFAYSLIDPQVSYLLEGFDGEVTTKRRSELLPVNYTNLKGGTYRFKMSLVDSHGNVGNEITVNIIKEKAIYEQTWFLVTAVVLAVALVALIVFIVMRRKTLKLMKKDREQREIIKQITEVLAKTIDMKDKYTNGHSSRVAKYTAMLAKELGYDDETVEKYYNIALLHDIGKISVPEEVLNKNGKLTDEEFRIIKSHPALGGEALREISIMPELAVGAESHHERPDGKGYPKGLKGEEIPRVGQIIAVADTFDAMYSDRPYRKRMNFDKVVSIMKEASGTQLTSDVVDAFLRLVDKGVMRDKNDTGGGTTDDIDNIHRKFENENKKEGETK